LAKAAISKERSLVVGFGTLFRDGSFLLVMLTVSTPAYVQLKKSDPAILAAESAATMSSGDLRLIRRPLR
jgi:hypothetical protein